MDSNNAILIIKALDGLSIRSLATAQNIANANTPDYRPLRVTFEQALADAASGGDAGQAAAPRVETVPAGARDGELRLDLELATASATAHRYSALVSMLDRQLQLQNLAIAGTVGGN